jgi:integrase/recombinase XerD
MLSAHVARYVSLRQAFGFTLRHVSRHLHAFARFAADRGNTHIRASTAVAWATEAPSLSARDVMHLARFLHGEDSAHEVPPVTIFPAQKVRPLPYIYAPEEIARILEAAGRLRRTYLLRRQVYTTLFGLIAATGLRVSEALDLRFDDLQPNGVLLIRRTKFGKSRLIPLHPTTAAALNRYLDARRQLSVTDDHLFLSAGNRRISASTVNMLRIGWIRHSCAVMMLQAARDIRKVALWLGYADVRTTEIYLRLDPSEKLEAVEAVLPPTLRRGRFKPPDALIASLLEPRRSGHAIGPSS